jgi:hypothetical protein
MATNSRISSDVAYANRTPPTRPALEETAAYVSDTTIKSGVGRLVLAPMFSRVCAPNTMGRGSHSRPRAP